MTQEERIGTDELVEGIPEAEPVLLIERLESLDRRVEVGVHLAVPAGSLDGDHRATVANIRGMLVANTREGW